MLEFMVSGKDALTFGAKFNFSKREKKLGGILLGFRI